MRFVARHALPTFVTFSMKSIDTFMSNSDTFLRENSDTFMTIHHVFPVIPTSCAFLFCDRGWTISVSYFERSIHILYLKLSNLED